LARLGRCPVHVRPETVVAWHRAGFRLYWRWRSRPRGGRPRITQQGRDWIGRLAKENPDWGAPQIHAELQELGFLLAERTVARYLCRRVRRGDPKHKWLAFLHHNREVIAALDFFTVPTIVTFPSAVLFLVIEHERRKILHGSVTEHPTAEGIVQPLREAFAEPGRYRYILWDGDRKFSGEGIRFFKASGLEPKRTSRQNGVAERWMGKELPGGNSGARHGAERAPSTAPA
jgi:hypothetical protein